MRTPDTDSRPNTPPSWKLPSSSSVPFATLSVEKKIVCLDGSAGEGDTRGANGSGLVLGAVPSQMTRPVTSVPLLVTIFRPAMSAVPTSIGTDADSAGAPGRGCGRTSSVCWPAGTPDTLNTPSPPTSATVDSDIP